jgi:hypothetical protein
MKKRMTEQQEFEIMKLVLDKFLWVGFVVMAFGVYKMLTIGVTEGMYYVLIGAVILILFLVLIVKEYEIIKR